MGTYVCSDIGISRAKLAFVVYKATGERLPSPSTIVKPTALTRNAGCVIWVPWIVILVEICHSVLLVVGYGIYVTETSTR
jgi:hypothetical protein